MKVLRSKENLRQKLKEQINFLLSSIKNYDDGNYQEAIRIAATLRILLYEFGDSHALLNQLYNLNLLTFLDTSSDYNPDNLVSFTGLLEVGFVIRPCNNFAHYLPLLDKRKDKWNEINFKEWWNKVVFVDKQKRSFCRKDLVLKISNQDGGAHVDPRLDEDHFDLIENNSLGWMASFGGKEIPIEHPELPSVRQIAFEVIQSLSINNVSY